MKRLAAAAAVAAEVMQIRSHDIHLDSLQITSQYIRTYARKITHAMDKDKKILLVACALSQAEAAGMAAATTLAPASSSSSSPPPSSAFSLKEGSAAHSLTSLSVEKILWKSRARAGGSGGGREVVRREGGCGHLHKLSLTHSPTPTKPMKGSNEASPGPQATKHGDRRPGPGFKEMVNVYDLQKIIKNQSLISTMVD